MNINEAKKVFLISTKIEFDSPDNSGAKEFVELREMNTTEMHQIMHAAKFDKEMEPTDIIGMLEQAEKLFPGCVVDSSFTKDDGSKASGREIYDVLKQSSGLLNDILSRWMNQGDGKTPFELGTANVKN